jgi:hypothetical protein
MINVNEFTTSQLRYFTRTFKRAIDDMRNDKRAYDDLQFMRKNLKLIKAELAKREAAKPVEPKTVLTRLYTDDDSFDVVLTKLRKVSHDDGCDASITTHYKATKAGGFRKMDRDDIRTALRDAFGRSCSHEHDCCGCYFGGAGGITVRRGALFFNTHYSRNV